MAWFLVTLPNVRFCFQGRLPVKWMAPEALFDRVYTHQSDVWVQKKDFFLYLQMLVTYAFTTTFLSNYI